MADSTVGRPVRRRAARPASPPPTREYELDRRHIYDGYQPRRRSRSRSRSRTPTRREREAASGYDSDDEEIDISIRRDPPQRSLDPPEGSVIQAHSTISKDQTGGMEANERNLLMMLASKYNVFQV
jgi:hypothetical protein